MIVIVSPGLLNIPVGDYGGIERVVYNLYKGFRAHSMESIILSPNNGGDRYIIDPRADHPRQTFNAAAEAWLKENLCNDDVVLLNHHSQKSIRAFLENVGLQFYELIHYKNSSGRTKLIVPSMFLRKTFFLLHNVVDVIPFPIDFAEFDLRNKEVAKISGDYLLNVGRIHRNKNPLLGARISKELGIKHVVVGPVQDESIKENLAEMGSLILPNSNSNDLINYYGHSLLSAALTTYFPPETYGLFQVEAYACGAKVLSSRSGGLKDTFLESHSVHYSYLSKFNSNMRRIEYFLKTNRSTPECIRENAFEKYNTLEIASRYLTLFDNDKK